MYARAVGYAAAAAPHTTTAMAHGTQRRRGAALRSMRSRARSPGGDSGWIVTGKQTEPATRAAAGLAFFFELFLFRRHEPRRRTQRFAVVEKRQIAHVERQRAGRRLLVDDDGDRTALHALAERDAAAAGQPGVRESLQHRPD